MMILTEDLPAVGPEALSAIIHAQQIRTLFQPIVDLQHARVYGYEALSRGPAGSALELPDILFTLADRWGYTWELEYTCRRLAIERFVATNCSKFLFLNVDPHIVSDFRFREGMTKSQLEATTMPASQVVLELTERSMISNYHDFITLLEHYKAQGFRMAIDDVGDGYAGLNLICSVKPKFLKLDRTLIRDIHRDAFKQQLIKFQVDFARATDITLIAEGIEEESELLTLIGLGIHYGQGFLLGRPAAALTELSPEMTERLRLLHHSAMTSEFRNVLTARVGDFTRVMPTLQPNDPGYLVEQAFAGNEELEGIPVVENGTPVGIIMREHYYMQLAKPYGYALFHKRPLAHVMDPIPMVVDFHDPLEQVSQLAMQRDRRQLYNHILVCNQGMYIGVITVRDLLERVTEQGMKHARYANPLTSLPGNIPIEREIERVVHGDDGFGIAYLDLDNFKALNDVYGFARGDDALIFTARLLREVFPTLPGQMAPFIGHIGGDDFVVIVQGQDILPAMDAFVARFDEGVAAFYDDAHRRLGYVTAVNRRGIKEQFPLMSISIAVVTQDNGPFENCHDVAKRAADVKKLCKMRTGSNILVDRRRTADEVEATPFPDTHDRRDPAGPAA